MSDGDARRARLADAWRDRVGEAVDYLGARGCAGRVGLILGSGLGAFADTLTGATAVPYGEIPGFRTTTVAEHKGRLVAGEAAGVPVIVMQGRLHPYEGLPSAVSLLPTAVLACLGIESAVVTNAAGGLNRLYEPGDLMVIREQLDMHLRDPLVGLLNDGREAGPDGRRPPGAGGPYDRGLARALAETGSTLGIPLHTGTYVSMWGPAYETRAEIGMLRRVGGDAVGMSTAGETLLLSRLGVRVVGLSCITNPSREVGQPELSHQDVVEVGNRVRARLERLLLAFLPRLVDIGTAP